MRKALWIIWALTLAAAFLAGRGMRRQPEPVTGNADTIVRVDTVMITAPREKYTRDAGVVAAQMVTADTVRDTVYVEVPLESKEYSGEGYRAYVSGWHASLDSIEIQRQTVIRMPEPPQKAKRFSVGLQAGVGVTPAGMQPYIGVGVSVRLW